MYIENANGSDFASKNLYNGQIRIKGRGNSSWERTDKKSYSIDLINDTGEENEIPLLGMAKNEDWILNACYFDKTLLRNYFACHLSNAMGRWASHGWFVELYINSEYRGLYMLCENIKKGKQRANVGDDGYIIEQDYPIRLNEEGEKYVTSSRIYENRYYHTIPEDEYLYFGFKYPKNDGLTPEKINYIKDYIADFESALYGDNFKDPQTGYRKYIDIHSFADWCVMAELDGDWDHCYFLSSSYFTKVQGEKMKAGPVWDFDIAYKTSIDYISARRNIPWIARMWEDDEFRQLVFTRFSEIWPLVENSISRIEDVAAELNRYGAIDRNFERWNILGTSIWTDTNPVPETYDGELRQLTQWIRERYLYASTFANDQYCDILKQMKPAIRVIDQDLFDGGKLPLTVEASAVVAGSTPYYIWNTVTQRSRTYGITDYGQYGLTIRVGTCESLPSDVLHVKRVADISLSGNKQIYDGQPKNVTATTNPPSLAVQITYNGSTDPPSKPGAYRVVAEIEDAEYKGKQVSTLTVTSMTGTPDAEETPLKIYPNPASNILYVERVGALWSKGELTLELIDMTGKLHIRKQIGDMKVSLDISALPKGLYLLRMTGSSRTVVRKIVIN